jgi:hypothetical protein
LACELLRQGNWADECLETDMGDILKFRQREAPDFVSRPSLAVSESAQILFFSGIRYEPYIAVTDNLCEPEAAAASAGKAGFPARAKPKKRPA